MSDFQKRVLEESIELGNKITKLGEFLKSDKVGEIDSDQEALLGIQLVAMQTYQRCLLARIDKM